MTLKIITSTIIILTCCFSIVYEYIELIEENLTIKLYSPLFALASFYIATILGIGIYLFQSLKLIYPSHPFKIIIKQTILFALYFIGFIVSLIFLIIFLFLFFYFFCMMWFNPCQSDKYCRKHREYVSLNVSDQEFNQIYEHSKNDRNHSHAGIHCLT